MPGGCAPFRSGHSFGPLRDRRLLYRNLHKVIVKVYEYENNKKDNESRKQLGHIDRQTGHGKDGIKKGRFHRDSNKKAEIASAQKAVKVSAPREMASDDRLNNLAAARTCVVICCPFFKAQKA